MNDYQEFRDLIREIIQEEVKEILKEQGFSRSVTGEVLHVSDDNRSCSVDVVTTKLNNILNKSGSSLKPGDTVTIMDSYGSNYSNCFVMAKNGQDLDTTGNMTKDISEIQAKIDSLEQRLPNNLSFSDLEGNSLAITYINKDGKQVNETITYS